MGGWAERGITVRKGKGPYWVSRRDNTVGVEGGGGESEGSRVIFFFCTFATTLPSLDNSFFFPVQREKKKMGVLKKRGEHWLIPIFFP